MRSYVFASLAFCFVCQANAQSATSLPSPESSTGCRIFVAGHSFHVPIYWTLDAIAKSAGLKDHVIVGKEVIGGSQIVKIWGDPAGKQLAKDALATGKIDILTLSPYQLPDEGIALFVDWGLKYNPSIRITLQESWLPFDATFEEARALNPQIPIDHNKSAEQIDGHDGPLRKATLWHHRLDQSGTWQASAFRRADRGGADCPARENPAGTSAGTKDSG